MDLKSIFFKNSISFSSERKQYLSLIVFILVILAIVMILYFGYWRYSLFSETESITSELIVNKGILAEIVIKKIDFDSSFIKTSGFQGLKVYGQWPLEVGEKGRQNPFLPY